MKYLNLPYWALLNSKMSNSLPNTHTAVYELETLLQRRNNPPLAIKTQELPVI